MTARRVLLCVALFFLISTIAGEGASTAPPADLSAGGVVLLLGDSILDCHKGEKRIEFVMLRLLQRAAPLAHWTIFNEAHGGEYIGPKLGNPVGVSEPLFSSETTGRFFEIVNRHPQADAVVINYAANDSKVYPPAVFRKRLEALARMLEQRYPGAVIVMSTSMYLDPHHAAPYHIENPQPPGFKDGDLRNAYLEPYNREIRELTAMRGYRLADTYRRLAAETAKGNWDLRLRADEGDPKNDPQHVGDVRWFDNIHPNDQGTEVIAEGLVEALLKCP